MTVCAADTACKHGRAAYALDDSGNAAGAREIRGLVLSQSI
jgi:hypothetical protein